MINRNYSSIVNFINIQFFSEYYIFLVLLILIILVGNEEIKIFIKIFLILTTFNHTIFFS